MTPFRVRWQSRTKGSGADEGVRPTAILPPQNFSHKRM